MAQPSFHISDELLERLDSQLEYGDSRSAFIRDAIKMKLWALENIDKNWGEMDTEERREFIRRAIVREMERVESDG